MRKVIVIVGLVASGLLGWGCSGDDGKDGAQGEPGPKGAKGDDGPEGPEGPQGEPGAQGEPGPAGTDGTGIAGAGNTDYLQTSCLSPCHGFTGIVEQWKTSTHYAAYVANLDGEEVDSWTGAKSCGNCHAVDGVEQRLAGNVKVTGTTEPANVTEGQITYKRSDTGAYTEAVYNGHASVAVVHCTTCHSVDDATDPHKTGVADYAAGSFPLRVPAEANASAFLEKSSAVGLSDGTAVSYGKGNACIWCHKSRKDVTNYITASNSTSSNWGPHEGPHSDVFTGKGGYSYAGKLYSAGSHSRFENGCVNCHMPSSEDFNQGIGDHSFKPQLSVCTECHGNQPSFDIGGAQSQTEIELQQLRVLLNNAQLLTREDLAGAALGSDELSDTEFALDKARSASGVTATTAGALYNYLLIARGSALGVHNPPYVGQLLYDSIDAMDDLIVNDSVTTFARPTYAPPQP